MASPAPEMRPWSNPVQRRLPLSTIDAVVSARLGPTRVPGNAQPACFNRQIAMYLAARFAGWSTTSIGEFYNGRDHSTVCYGIQRVEALLESDPEVDALITELKRVLEKDWNDTPGTLGAPVPSAVSSRLSQAEIEAIAERVAARVCERLRSPSNTGFQGRLRQKTTDHQP